MAEEVVQEAFLAIWRNPAMFRPERGPFLRWLTSLVRNRAIDAVRHETVKGQARPGVAKMRAVITGLAEHEAEGGRVLAV